jgi:hypothetical protein
VSCSGRGTPGAPHAASQLGIPKYGVSLKYLHEFAARARFQGQGVTMTFVLPLDPLFEKVAGFAR